MENREELSYIAGFFDGEGYISLSYYKKKNTFCLCAGVNNTNKYVLLEIKKIFGGNINTYSDKRNKNWKPLHRWKVFNQQALNFLKFIHPYLKIKNEKCYWAIKFQEKQKKGIRTMNLNEKLSYRKRIMESD